MSEGKKVDPIEDEYNGNPILNLTPDVDPRRSFKFGLAKAKLILENIEHIKRFVEKHT